MKNVIYDDLESLKILKVTPDTPEGEIEKHVADFMNDASRNIFLLTANMQDVTVKMINYLRIVVEQQENVVEQQENRSIHDDKLVVIVLHFPQAQFFDQCYPALFLTGWDHFYLDSLTTDIKVEGVLKPLRNVVDIKQCFRIALRMATSSDMVVSIDLEPLLEEAIPVISSRVIVGSSGREYNGTLSISARQDQLKKLFIEEKLERNDQLTSCTPIGKAFCSLFHQYWDNKTVTVFLKDAARFTFSHQSTLSITSYIQTRIKALFFEFIVYVLWKINEDCNLDTVFSMDIPTEVLQKLFADVINTLFPNLPSLYALSICRNLPPPEDKGFKFPFFNMTFHDMEELLDGCQEIVNKRNSSKTFDLTTSYSARTTKDILEKDMFKEMKEKLEQIVEVSQMSINSFIFYFRTKRVL